MSKKLFLFPFGGSAREALVAILSSDELKKQWDVVGFIDDDSQKKGQDCCGVKVLGGKEVFEQFEDEMVLALPAHPKDYLKRKDIIAGLSLNVARFATIIHPSSVVSRDARIGYNAFVAPHCFISSKAVIGNHCIILSNTVISHDAEIGEYCCLGANVVLSGTVKIETESYIGSRVSIKEGVTVGAQSLVGIGANVVSSLEPGVVAVGNPAKVLRKNK
ncbi:MAG: acetyltransferase [Candidatus Aceula meridiana]|nr:acetyltransferase [Candidatus Aceula meridiana]